MHKQPYEQVFAQMELFWLKEFDDSDSDGINNHCDLMISFVESCGWDVDDFIRQMMKFPSSLN